MADNGDLKALVRTIPDFPKPGIEFRDITTLLADAAGFAATIDRLGAIATPLNADYVVGIEARGFIVGAALARAIGAGFVPVRKPGKLPGQTVGIDYVLEYGSDRLEIHADQLPPGARVILADDLIATGGTALAATQLIREQGAHLLATLFVIDLPDLDGATLLRAQGIDVHALIAFEGH